MNYLNLFLLFSLMSLCCYAQEVKLPPGLMKGNFIPVFHRIAPAGLKWHDSLFKHLPKNIDTSIVIKDANGTALKFCQYVKPVFSNEAIIYQQKGEWRLHRLTATAKDSLDRDDFAVARVLRAQAYLNPTATKNWKLKLDEIAHTLAQADFVVVNKSKREMILQRKGVTLKTFKINLGFSPVGNKLSEGDGKTPEGLYYLDLKTNRTDGFYKSIWISYPNAADQQRSAQKGLKPGVGIAIHGTTKKATLAKDWTAGCIALQNKDMDSLFAYISEGTPIEIRK